MKSEQFMNLKMHRSEAQPWERRGWLERYGDERTGLWLMSIAGASLLLFGAFSASRRTPSRLGWVLSGAGLLGCAAGVGSRHRLRSLRTGRDPVAEDVVTVESLDSFPASDAPSSNATTASPRPLRSGD